MAKDKNSPEKFTGEIKVTGIPLDTVTKIESKTERLGITKAGYIKNLINADLKGDKMDNFNKAG